jgi:hypothetical protein
LPASFAGASLTPRELSHYAIEVMPPLAMAIAALMVVAFRSTSRRTWIRVAAAAAAVPLALSVLVASAEAVLILPARQVALMEKSKAPPPFLHNFSYPGLPAYYGRWIRWMAQEPWRAQGLDGFPGPFPEEAAEADSLSQLAARDSSIRILVLGDRAWVYFLARRLPASRYIAQNSGFRLLPTASGEVAGTLDARRAQLVAVADAPPGDWLGRLEANKYELVSSQPWPTYAAGP